MSKNWPVIIFLSGIIIGNFIDGALAMAITFGVILYIVSKVKKAIQLATDIEEN